WQHLAAERRHGDEREALAEAKREERESADDDVSGPGDIEKGARKRCGYAGADEKRGGKAEHSGAGGSAALPFAAAQSIADSCRKPDMKQAEAGERQQEEEGGDRADCGRRLQHHLQVPARPSGGDADKSEGGSERQHIG